MSNDTLPYQVTTEPLQEPDFPAEMAHEHEALFYGAQEGRSSALRRLRELVKRYPRVREFQSWLYSGYRLQDREQEAKKVLDQMLKDHPDYLFARLNQAGLHLDKEQTEPVLKLLGQNLELTDLYPDRTRFHLSEALSFEYESARYFLTTGNLPAAEERYRRLRLIAPDGQAAKNIGAQLAMARMRRNLANLIEKQIPPQEVDSHPTYTPESWTERPSFRHPETEQLYHYGVDLPEAIVEAMLALPRDSFIADLELVLEDAIRRYETIRAGDPESEEDFDFLTFPIHAVRFLGALEAEASLPAVLNLFRQGEERLSFWFGDMMFHYTRDSLYRIAQNQLDALRDFALEPHLFYEPRSIASEVAALVALHQPERRAEVLDWYRAVYDRLLAHPDDETRIDTYFINTLNGDLLDIRAVELAPYLNRVAEAGWLDPTSAGSLEEMLAELETPIEEHRKNPLPESPVEVFTRDHWNRHREKMFQGGKLELPEPDDAFRDFLELMGRRGEPDQAIPEEEEDEYHPPYTPPKTVKRSQPKVGRNDPCPCGSGKKYKKCCGKP